MAWPVYCFWDSLKTLPVGAAFFLWFALSLRVEGEYGILSSDVVVCMKE
jgi:hypothetical protein